MSVYIKDMEMPKSCEDCRFCENDGVPWCCVMRRYIDEISCPLIPVPEHGRLIDADALIATERETFEDYHISEAPTIIPADKEEQT